MSDIKFSVIIPVLNRAYEISECIESLLGQSLGRDQFEVIIVDNGSTDHTATVVKNYPVKFYQELKRGPAAARNTGARYARGKYLAFMDSDCIADKSWLSAFERRLRKEKEECIAGGLTESFYSHNALQRFLSVNEGPRKIRRNLKKQNFVSTHNMAISRSLFEKLGGFGEEFVAGEDIDLCWRAEKLNTRILLCEEARVLHKFRQNLKQLIRQRIHWGYYLGLLNQRHPEKYSPVQTLMLFLKTGMIFLLIPLSFLLFLADPYKRTRFFFLFFIFGPTAAGRLMYTMKRLSFFFLRPGIKAQKK